VIVEVVVNEILTEDQGQIAPLIVLIFPVNSFLAHYLFP
jgi:hypothetical protein